MNLIWASSNKRPSWPLTFEFNPRLNISTFYAKHSGDGSATVNFAANLTPTSKKTFSSAGFSLGRGAACGGRPAGRGRGMGAGHIANGLGKWMDKRHGWWSVQSVFLACVCLSSKVGGGERTRKGMPPLD